MKKRIFIAAVIGMAISLTSVGQTKNTQNNSKSNLALLKKQAREHPPKAILVQLNTRKRLMEYYTKSQQDKKLQALKQDITGFNNAMIADFTDNYKYGPVYFFYDTNADAIREKKFDGVLLDKDLKPANNIILTDADSNYFIAYFGATTGSGATSSLGYKSNTTRNELQYSSDNIKREAHRLRLLDPQLNELPQYVVRDAYDIDRNYRSMPKYSYNSSLLNIYYWAFAAQLEKNFRAFYNGQ